MCRLLKSYRLPGVMLVDGSFRQTHWLPFDMRRVGSTCVKEEPV
jgi:hypothetical protein